MRPINLLFLLPLAACSVDATDNPTSTSAPSGHAVVDDALEDRLAADDGAPLEVVVHVDVPRLHAAPLPERVATLEVGEGGSAIATLDGRRVTARELDDRAEADRAAIDESLADQLAARAEVVDEAIRDAGLDDAVVARGDSWFRARLLPADARAMLDTLGDRLRGAALAVDLPAVADLTDATNVDGVGALDEIGITFFSQAYNMKGQGIGIFHNEGYAPYEGRADLAGADIRTLSSAHMQPVRGANAVCVYDDECCSNDCSSAGACVNNGGCACGTNSNGSCKGDIRGQEHSTMVSVLLHKVAPLAVEYHAGTTLDGCMISTAVATQSSPHVYVGSQSWSYEGDGATNSSYDVLGDCNEQWDGYIRASRIAHFHSSGNSDAAYVGSPARAYNVIAVGNYSHVNESMTYNGAFIESGRLDPGTGVEKPEIVAPGTWVSIAAGWSRFGSSISAPIAAAFAADMMSGSAFFKNQPQAIKAYLIAGAHNVRGGVGFAGSNGEYDGAGRIDYLDTYFYRSGKTWNGGNAAFFDANHKITETTTLEAGKHYTIAIAWLADGYTAYDWSDTSWLNLFKPARPLDQTMRLTVKRGAYAYSQYVAANNFQLVDLTVPAGQGGTWTVEIERVTNEGVGNVDLALTVGLHQ